MEDCKNTYLRCGTTVDSFCALQTTYAGEQLSNLYWISARSRCQAWHSLDPSPCQVVMWAELNELTLSDAYCTTTRQSKARNRCQALTIKTKKLLRHKQATGQQPGYTATFANTVLTEQDYVSSQTPEVGLGQPTITEGPPTPKGQQPIINKRFSLMTSSKKRQTTIQQSQSPLGMASGKQF